MAGKKKPIYSEKECWIGMCCFGAAGVAAMYSLAYLIFGRPFAWWSLPSGVLLSIFFLVSAGTSFSFAADIGRHILSEKQDAEQ